MILYVHPYVGCTSWGIPTPSEVIDMYGGICPRCGRKLEKPTFKDITIQYGGTKETIERILEELEREAGDGNPLARTVAKILLRCLEKCMMVKQRSTSPRQTRASS